MRAQGPGAPRMERPCGAVQCVLASLALPVTTLVVYLPLVGLGLWQKHGRPVAFLCALGSAAALAMASVAVARIGAEGRLTRRGLLIAVSSCALALALFRVFGLTDWPRA